MKPPPNAPNRPPRTRSKFHQTHESHRSFHISRMHTESFVCARMPSSPTRKKPPRSFHISRKALSKFPTAPQTEVFRHSNKPFKFPYTPKVTPKFLHSAKPRFLRIQTSLSSFPIPRNDPEVSPLHIAEVSTRSKRPLQVSIYPERA